MPCVGTGPLVKVVTLMMWCCCSVYWLLDIALWILKAGEDSCTDTYSSNKHFLELVFVCTDDQHLQLSSESHWAGQCNFCQKCVVAQNRQRWGGQDNHGDRINHPYTTWQVKWPKDQSFCLWLPVSSNWWPMFFSTFPTLFLQMYFQDGLLVATIWAPCPGTVLTRHLNIRGFGTNVPHCRRTGWTGVLLLTASQLNRGGWSSSVVLNLNHALPHQLWH